MKNGDVLAQFKRLDNEVNPAHFAPSIKIHGAKNGTTNYMNITIEQLEKIKAVLLEGND